MSEKICPLYKAALLTDKNPVTETWELRYMEMSLCDGERGMLWEKCSGRDQVQLTMDDSMFEGLKIDLPKEVVEP